ncbi:hypothetical protein FGG08_004279 [Glutinoglossum americanum]|uniref:NACHT domain-containing protein n=1 Tax=Glutinoglossum americanum TaxID=1670608 RepID=A0A9P8L2M9_9PEZI|nr:hypothetical protein FGG08_004279 [Glutinoglossum americanum]
MADSIVALHGLNGDPVRTWSFSDNRNGEHFNIHWLKELLPYKVPRARIMTFGYHASVWANPSAMGIRENAQSLLSYLVNERQSDEEAKRPILWIGHSLGGIMIKEMFFGTPHRGSTSANWANQLVLVGRVAFKKLSNTYLKELRANSEELERISEAFIPIASRYHIISFYEELNHPTLGKLVVTKHSAVLGLPNEDVVMMNDSDHCDMCRFKSLDDPRFSLVWKRIQKLNLTNTQKQTMAKLSAIQKDCLALLSVTDIRDARDIAASSRYNGTNDWILSDETFRKWKQSSENSLLWILGGPGYGKTVLSAAILDHLDCTAEVRIENFLVTFFFWNETDHRSNNAVAMYRSTLWQLLRQQPALFRHVIPNFEIQRHQLFESVQSLTRVLTSILDDPKLPGVFLVLDAFDECDENSQHGILRNFCSLLKQGRSSTSRKLKILITSRTYDGIRGSLDEYPSIVLTPENLRTDISNYVKQRVQEIAKVRHYNVSLAAKVEEFVSSESNGMFLWASLILKDLEKTPLRAVDSKLRSPPKGLWHVYDSLLQAMHDDARETTRDILNLVITAIRPLTLHELAMVMRFQHDKKACPRYDSSLADIEGDIQLCGPILVIRDDSVHLVHQSAKDFLVAEARHAEDYPSLDYFGVKLKRGHHILAEVCLSYLSSKEFTSGPLEDVQFQYGNDAAIAAHHGKFPLLAYAAACWLQHVRLSDAPEELNPRIKLLASGATFMAWFQMYWFSREMYLPYPENFTPFHMAAHFHLPSYLEKHLLDEGVDALEPVYYGTPLHAAAWAGDNASVEILLKRNAKVDVVGGRYGTALQAAAGNGREAMVESLLRYGATVNASTMCGAHGNPLLAASLKGYHQIVRLLLKHGAHVNTYQSDGFFNLAFKTAVGKGHKRIVDRLLRADADVHAQAQGVDYGTALQKACENGQEDVVELLLTSGMETEMRKDSTQRYDFGTALQAAVSAGHVEVVRLLLDAGADIEARGERNGSALVTAASLGHSELVRILLSAGAQISQVFGGYGNALIAASANGRLDVVGELLGAGADVNHRGGYFGSALRAAATFGHVPVVDALLTAGAEDSSDGVYCGTALEAARENNQLNVVSTLLKHRLGNGSSSRSASDTTINVEELLAILDGDWRGYYFYSAGNCARDEGEVFFELKSKAAHPESATRVTITGSGEDKWGKFVIDGTAEVSSQVEFNKDYAEWGWTYKGRLSKSQQAIGGTWGRAGNDTHGTFAFHRVRDHIKKVNFRTVKAPLSVDP